MSEHHGEVTLGDQSVPVTVAFDADGIRLASNGNEIGRWTPEECEIVDVGPGNFLIRAEDEELPFTPTQLDQFTAALHPDSPTPAAGPGRHRNRDEEPEATLITKVLFYVLAASTAVLGLWAFWSLVS